MSTDATLASLPAALDTARAAGGDALATLESLVRIPSISAANESAGDVRRSADAVEEVLRASGLENVRQATTNGSHPYVIGDWVHHDPAAVPTVLLYAHHDVQPPGVVENWHSDPFEPRQAEGRLYGRGSADDKAGAVAHAAAVAGWLDSAGALPCNVRVLVEGEEEIGSPNLEGFLHAHVDELASDVLVLADAGNWSVGTPGVTYSLRGLAALDIRVRSVAGPLHSGMAGGVVPDPVQALAKVLAALTDAHGTIAIPGFLDDVRPLTDSERSRVAALPANEKGLRRAFGVVEGVELVGDPSLTTYERQWFQPSLTVIGFDSHPLKGSSNQIVASATARLSLRLAPGQDPDRAFALLTSFLQAQVPWGLEVDIILGESAPAWVCEPEGWAFDATDRALRTGFGTDPVYMGVGGSIPFVGPFAEAFGGIPALLLGPADPTSAIHGENESLHIGDWHSLIAGEIALLAELAAAWPSRPR